MIERTYLTDIVRRLGPADIYVGDPMTADGLEYLGTLEGERRGEIEFADNVLTMPEHTGAIPHEILTQVNAARVVGTLVMNDTEKAIWEKISPNASNAGGTLGFITKPTTGVLLIPQREIGRQLMYTGSHWLRVEEDDSIVSGGAAAPIHALWLWKAHVKHGPMPFGFEDGGKTKVEVTFEAMLDADKPSGAMVYLVGDPYDFETPIEVLAMDS